MDLLAAADKYEDLPQLRIGVASGLAVRRAGDWFAAR
jgi:adenylate cyclase